MPLYEYRCKKCGARFERIQKFSDAPLVKCEKCGGKIERLLSSPAIQFKGTGWYVTDYPRKSSPGAGDADRAASSSDGGGKPESSPAGKAETSTAGKTETSSTGKTASSPAKKKNS
ncbi:MAG TPA: FmdB family zinc ribbon protein [Terriglobia bacterium]|nr:FmdB family zinc ribbon protein [Terriglobia bacterium]